MIRDVKSGDVSLRNISKHFGNQMALDQVDLDVPAGAFVTLLGPSGCGKTTMLRIIAGLEMPDRGDVFVRGRNVATQPPHARDIAMVFQHYALFPHLSVSENIAFGLKERRLSSGEIRKRVGEILEMIGLSERANDYPRHLSGGQQQRAALARALVVRPAVVLLDEPLSSLDVMLRRQMQLELKRIQRQVATTFVAVTHDQDEALSMSDEIVVMNNGRIEQIGSPESVFRTPATPFVATFLGSQNVINVSVVEAPDGGSRIVIGSMEMTLPEKVPVGPGRVAIRSEHVEPGAPGGLAGTVQERTFRGAVVNLTIALEDGQYVTATISADAEEAMYQPGTRTTLRFRPEGVTFLH